MGKRVKEGGKIGEKMEGEEAERVRILEGEEGLVGRKYKEI